MGGEAQNGPTDGNKKPVDEPTPIWGDFLNFWPLGIALVATASFGRFAWNLAHQLTKQDGVFATRWEHFLHGRPNELGDTLSGFVGSLTLIWVVASVVQQSMELRAQRKEFSEMVAAQSAQVLALDAQAEIFREERRRSNEKQVASAFNNEIRTLLESLFDVRGEFSMRLKGTPYFEEKIISESLVINHTSDGYRENDATLKAIIKSLVALSERIQTSDAELEILHGKRTCGSLEDFSKSLSDLEKFRPRLSFVTNIRLDKFKISETKIVIESLLKYLGPSGVTP